MAANSAHVPHPIARQRVVPTMFVLAALGACNESGDGGGSTSAPQYWVYIESTDEVVSSALADLNGLATCDACPPAEVAFGYCPPIQGPIPSDVDVVWTNLTTGQSGTAFHGISGHCGCLFSYCTVSYSHRWTAQVPLAVGPNLIELMAFGPFEDAGTERITITRVPPQPQGLEAESGRGQIVLSWEPVPLANTYDLYWSTSPLFDLATADRIPGVTSPFVHSGLADDVTYTYAVTAAIGEYASAPSSVAWATAGWRSEALPVPQTSAYVVDASIAVDSLDLVHVHVSRSESVGTASSIHDDYVTNRDGAWTSIPVGDSSAEDAEIALDSRDVVHVSYVGFQGPVHAYRPQDAWLTEVVAGGLGCGTSLAVDALDKVHVACIARTTGPAVTQPVRYATNATGAWILETVGEDSAGCVGQSSPSLAVEPDGTAHLAYVGPAPEYGVEYASNRGGSWSHSAIVPGYATGVSLALDAFGDPHVAYCDESSRLHVAHGTGSGTWELESVDASIYAAPPALTFDPGGDVLLGYVTRWPAGELRLARKSGGAWSVLRIATADGPDAALAVDTHGSVHIAYFLAGVPRHATNR